MKKTTIYEMFIQGGYETIVEMTLFECGCDKVELPLDTYYEAIDGDLDEYLEDWLAYEYAEDYYQIETTDSSLILVNKVNRKCDECTLGKIYMKDMPRPVGFEDVMLFHGILAYERNIEDIDAAKEHLNKVLTIPTYETCCSTDPLGPVGVVLEGTVVLASNCDLGSMTDDKGRFYYANNDAAEYIIYDADYLTFGTDGFNDEIVTIENKIKAVWVKETANNNIKIFAEELAKEYGVELMIEPEIELDEEFDM